MKIKKIDDTRIPGVKIITPDIFEDERGYFFETFNENDFLENGLPINFVQDNQAFSKQGTLRGFHYQLNYPQGKLVRVIHGEVLDVALDIRVGSPTFGRYIGERLSDMNHKIMYIPEGFAHGYLVLSETAIFQYKCTGVYHPEDEYGVIWDDNEIDVKWPIKDPILSLRDRGLTTLQLIDKKILPKYSVLQ